MCCHSNRNTRKFHFLLSGKSYAKRTTKRQQLNDSPSPREESSCPSIAICGTYPEIPGLIQRYLGSSGLLYLQNAEMLAGPLNSPCALCPVKPFTDLQWSM